MDILSEVYYKTAAENERNVRFWENYLQSLKNLDFSEYSDKFKVPILVPIGSRILFRGELKHTNEVTVALGADYFVKCSLKQAEVLRQHRIKDAQSKLDIFQKEKDYLENQMSFTKKNVFENQGKEIIEYYSEEDDKAWRLKHRENVRHYKQTKGKEERNEAKDITDDELWERLEELELQEELENELNIEDNTPDFTKIKQDKDNSLLLDENLSRTKPEEQYEKTIPEKSEREMKAKRVTFQESETVEESSKVDILQHIMDRQNELEEKLHELKNRERAQTKSENDLMSRLDELEQLDELEDEMNRLEDIIDNEDVEEGEEDSNKTGPQKLQRRVSFVDEDDSETLELTFKHSPVEPHHEPYDPTKGIQKPSDIYEAHSNLFGNGTTSILKKSKYETVSEPKVKKEMTVQFDKQDSEEHETIVVKDVVEKEKQPEPVLLSQARPTSLFKKKRMQNKSS
uniref:Unconventional prefoldin RPB5 interactor n=1 Tax=Heliothis virescens TaxID=7102 RepID=A0A2A4JMK5_HELVI